MLHVLLLILKIIGITIAVILGLLLLVILLVLFVSVKYKGIAKKQGDDIKAGFKVSWLFHLVSVKATFENKELKYSVKIFGIQIIPKKEKKAVTEANVEVPEAVNTETETYEAKPTDAEAETYQDAPVNAEIETYQANPTDIEAETHQTNPTDTGTETHQTNSIDAELQSEETVQKKSLIGKIIDKFRNIKYTIKSLYDKIKDVLENIRYYKEILTGELAHSCYAKVKQVLYKLLKHIAPGKLRGNLLIGFDDPATTGQVLGYICMFYPIYGNNINVRADFENKVLDANLKFKGRIRLVVLLVGALRLWRDKNIKRLIAILKRGRR